MLLEGNDQTRLDAATVCCCKSDHRAGSPRITQMCSATPINPEARVAPLSVKRFDNGQRGTQAVSGQAETISYRVR